MEIRSEASRKANETRGPEGRSEASRKGNETRNEFLDWIPSDENPALIFEHTCPKCNEVSVKYHKPPTEEENELVEKSFGWRGDIIQYYCIQCRSIKTENKKPGFFSRFQKKKSKEELEEKYARETTPEVLKKAITEFKKGELYHRDIIRQKLDLGFSGGIRASVKNNVVVLFWNAPSDNVDQSDDGFAPNIYEDYFNAETGLYHYIGEGQIGDQTLDSGSGGNKRIAKAKEQGRTIHLFHQHNKKEKHEYLGQVELVGITKERQADVERNDREVLVFLLKPV